MSNFQSWSLQICQVIQRLRQLTELDVQANWRYSSEDFSLKKNATGVFCQELNISTWQIAQPDEKGYITWSAGHQVRWLAQRFVVPQDLQGYPLSGMSLRLVLTWWAQVAQIFVNGQLVQEGDLFDSSARILLASAVVPGETILVAVRLVSPGHDIGALMGSKCVYETETIAFAEELTVLHEYLKAFEPEKLAELAAILAAINWTQVRETAFRESLLALRQKLIPLGAAIGQRQLHLLGHAHLDMAWLWTVDETWSVGKRTFTSVLNLQQKFPFLTFAHSTPALYAWIEKYCPDLFAEIVTAVKDERWEIVGGMWVEPEVNLAGGESLVRQLLYGQRYCQEKFGTVSSVAWLPDSFGFCWQLPQIMAAGGIEYFVTGKLHWNDSTKFPHGVFWWQSPDGTRLLTLMSPPNLTGVMDTNPVTMANYALRWEQQTGLKDAFWLPGVGDHGGGPTADMLAVYQQAARSPFFPRLEFTTAAEYIKQIENRETEADFNSQFPVWDDELYLEFHRGCYTSHADQKRYNRHCENLLYEAEVWASLATISTDQAYPKQQLEGAWKKVLFNQFHDILPGTSIPAVFEEANQQWQQVQKEGAKILADSLGAIASQITLPSPPQPLAQPIFVFNSLNWQRSEVVSCRLPPDGDWAIYDLDGQQLPSQREGRTLLFLATDIPSVGYRLFWLCQTTPESRENIQKSQWTQFVLENTKLRVVIDPKTGNLSSIFDKIEQREILSGAGNQLQAFRDQGQYWDAWNIDPNYTQHPLPPARLKSIEWREKGLLRWRVRVIKQLGDSEFCQDYILEADSPLLKIATTVDWQESHVLVKAAFPLNLESNSVTYEIPCGVIQRPTRPQTAADQAKWEVPALRWADLTDDQQNYGVSLINDCKYGYDSQADQLRLTLLRSPTWPDPQSDRGIHQFTYALYPHSGGWQSAKTVRQGYQLNAPLQVVIGAPMARKRAKRLPTVGQFLDLHSENLILMALKQSEDDPQTYILRCYEAHGEATELSPQFNWEGGFGVDEFTSSTMVCQKAIASRINLLEHPLDTSQIVVKNFTDIKPWQIASFKLATPLRGNGNLPL